MTKPSQIETGAIEDDALESNIRDAISPEAVVAIIAHLQSANVRHPENPAHVRAVSELEWFRGMLMGIVGVDEFNRIIDEIEL